MFVVGVYFGDNKFYAKSPDGAALHADPYEALRFESFESAEEWARRLYENWIIERVDEDE